MKLCINTIQVAEYLDNKLTGPAVAESLKTKKARQARPENSKFAQAVVVNSVIYKRLDKRTKSIDGGLRQIQELAVKAAVAASKVATRVIEMMKSDSTELQAMGKSMYDDAFDALCLSSQASYKVNMNRVSYHSFNSTRLVFPKQRVVYTCSYL